MLQQGVHGVEDQHVFRTPYAECLVLRVKVEGLLHPGTVIKIAGKVLETSWWTSG